MFAALMKFMRDNNVLPRISDTERQALEAGTVWIDGQIFSGNPDFKSMLKEPYSKPSDEEQAFIDGPTETLCRMIDHYDVISSRQVPENIIQYIKDQGFMGMLIPKEYGGKGFSTLAISTIMAKVNSYNPAVGTFVVIPNSLGAAELLNHYGTDEQKRAYLPKLASGEYVPCFGLTEPTAGSDAASIRAEGVVYKDASGEVKIRLNFRKRYITLAPVSNLISLAFQMHDPDNLLGKGEYPGITVVMLHKGTKGLENGDHHMPIGLSFYNGPIIGKDVEVSVDQIIGGPDYAGQGWRMLMEQLAGGRAVSLPAGAIGGMKLTAAATGAYSVIRHQFGIPIGLMEGVQEKVARIAAFTYLFEGARVYSCSALDAGEQPPVVSALLKYASTEYGQKVLIDGMDVFSGAGVMQGPNNILGGGYASAPVSITVEGANIMTRTLITFGQGATRCHPYALPMVKAVEENDATAFRKKLLGWLMHTGTNFVRSKIRGISRGFSAGSPESGAVATYYRRLAWASSRYALLADLALYLVGSKLKARGNLGGRFADALTWQVLAFSALRRFKAEGSKQEDLPLLQYSCEYALARIQEAFEGIHANFDVPVVGWWLKGPSALFLRLNPLSRGPSDKLIAPAAATVQKFDEQFRRLTSDTAPIDDDQPGMGRLMKAFRLHNDVQPLLGRIRDAQKSRELPRGLEFEVVDEAVQRKVLTPREAVRVKEAEEAALAAIEVDVFTPENYFQTPVAAKE
ncbi:acyl-CoA dehydrogenase [Pseudohongiella nitratireducens]|uniref:Acyl-coenzyme A dehydrogenase n=1 Tax=Pseudohongiella nitratireducens TaxID=1768907 RepID=A0A916VIZ0_9GAMM|nr:acyl-CoA dehydrogenase [Pseudohongiella nitratireducens]MDF1623266.1 acyl-CoA dehydrogenase [Pseudohongiella nitratireducens]GFZ75733.1 acyl-CoA dehydrogenase [Pseudohongiella nitratireducens]